MNFQKWKAEMEDDDVDHFGELFEQTQEDLINVKAQPSISGAWDTKFSLKSYSAKPIPDIAPVRTVYRE